MKRHLTIVSIPHCFWCTDLILELKFTLLWSNWENVLVWTHLCCPPPPFHNAPRSNGKLVTQKSGKWESGNPLFLPQFCSYYWLQCKMKVLLLLMSFKSPTDAHLHYYYYWFQKEMSEKFNWQIVQTRFFFFLLFIIYLLW